MIGEICEKKNFSLMNADLIADQRRYSFARLRENPYTPLRLTIKKNVILHPVWV
jgi:hypothetical protein